jgi:ribosome maturation factor RimP
MKQQIVLDLLNEALLENNTLFIVEVKFLDNNKINIILDGDNGINLKECIRISRYIENNLDREEEDYSLEVSSPDIATPIKNIRQYNKNIGRILKLKTKEKKFEGTLIEVKSDELILEWKAREPKPIGKGKITVTKNATVAFDDILEAKVKIVF